MPSLFSSKLQKTTPPSITDILKSTQKAIFDAYIAATNTDDDERFSKLGHLLHASELIKQSTEKDLITKVISLLEVTLDTVLKNNDSTKNFQELVRHLELIPVLSNIVKDKLGFYQTLQPFAEAYYPEGSKDRKNFMSRLEDLQQKAAIDAVATLEVRKTRHHKKHADTLTTAEKQRWGLDKGYGLMPTDSLIIEAIEQRPKGVRENRPALKRTHHRHKNSFVIRNGRKIELESSEEEYPLKKDNRGVPVLHVNAEELEHKGVKDVTKKTAYLAVKHLNLPEKDKAKLQDNLKQALRNDDKDTSFAKELATKQGRRDFAGVLKMNLLEGNKVTQPAIPAINVKAGLQKDWRKHVTAAVQQTREEMIR